MRKAVLTPDEDSGSNRIDALSGRVLPTSKSDVDNYVKGASDAIRGIVMHDDAQVVSLTATKAHGDQPQIRSTVELLDSRRS